MQAHTHTHTHTHTCTYTSLWECGFDLMFSVSCEDSRELLPFVSPSFPRISDLLHLKTCLISWLFFSYLVYNSTSLPWYIMYPSIKALYIPMNTIPSFPKRTVLVNCMTPYYILHRYPIYKYQMIQTICSAMHHHHHPFTLCQTKSKHHHTALQGEAVWLTLNTSRCKFYLNNTLKLWQMRWLIE